MFNNDIPTLALTSIPDFIHLSEVATVIRQECGQTLGRVRVRIVVIISLQRTKG